MPRPLATTLLTLVLAGLTTGLTAGCTSSAHQTPTTVVTGTQTIVHTQTVTASPGSFTPELPAYVRGLAPGDKPQAGTVEGPCPYIKTGLNVTGPGGVNMANLEGDRIYRVVRLTKYHPVGCRFYFIYGAYEATADIRPFTFATSTEARNAMILTARTGHDLITQRNFVKGYDGISFRTKFFDQDGKQDWAFAFAKGKRMVVVYTQRTDQSVNALYIAQAIAGKF